MKTLTFQVRFLSLLITSLALSACPAKKNDSSGEDPNKKVVHVHGDPSVFIQGDALNNQSPITEELLKDMGKMTLNIIIFQEHAEEVTYEQAVEQQKPKDKSDEIKKAQNNYFIPQFNPESIMISAEDGNAQSGKFSFERSDKVLTLQEFSFGGDAAKADRDFEVLHYSLSKDKQAFSILLRGGIAPDRGLLALTFVKAHPTTTLELTKLPYNSILGPGVKIGWDKGPLEITFCGTAPAPFVRLVAESMNRWNPILPAPMQLSYKSQTSCPPFSDLNTHSVKYVKGWIDILDPENGTLGMTLPGYDLRSGRMIDSDIVILLEEYQQALDKLRPGRKVDDPAFYLDSTVQAGLKRTLTHEFGHLLGLGHQFDPNIFSIMSYSDQKEITEYDRESVQFLFGKSAK